MKRGKFAFVAVLFIAIILIQPSNREALISLFHNVILAHNLAGSKVLKNKKVKLAPNMKSKMLTSKEKF